MSAGLICFAIIIFVCAILGGVALIMEGSGTDLISSRAGTCNPNNKKREKCKQNIGMIVGGSILLVFAMLIPVIGIIKYKKTHSGHNLYAAVE